MWSCAGMVMMASVNAVSEKMGFVLGIDAKMAAMLIVLEYIAD